jgi:hypothetical protein
MAQPERRPEEKRPDHLRPVGPQEPAPAAQPRQTSGKAVAGLIMSLISIFAFGLILGALGIVFGVLGLGEINRGERSGKPVAWAAVIIGGISVAAVLFFIGTGQATEVPSSLIQRLGLL